MDVTIIGAGNMGRGIGTRLVAGGNRVKILDHDPEQAGRLAEEVEAATQDGGTAEGGSAEDALSGDVVVLAVWYPASLAALEEHADELEGKVVVDISNPVDTQSFDGLVTPEGSSAAEEIAQKAPQGTRVVKAFNTTFAGTLLEGGVGGEQLDVLIAGDDADAKATVARLAESGGLNAIDAGGLKRARELERLGFLHMAIQEGLGTNYGTAIKVVRPG